MDRDYLLRLSYIPTSRGAPRTTYADVREAGYLIDAKLDDLTRNEALHSGKPVPVPRTAPAVRAPFRDPDAMDIDASRLDDELRGKSEDEIRSWHRKWIQDKCRVCGSKDHVATDKHREAVCNHCSKKGHYAKICLSRLQSKPASRAASAKASISATASSSASSSGSSSSNDDRDAEIAALKDQLTSMQKVISSFASGDGA